MWHQQNQLCLKETVALQKIVSDQTFSEIGEFSNQNSKVFDIFRYGIKTFAKLSI
jgi:hypothetical protein